MFETTVRDGVCRCRRPDTRWLATGPDGGFSTADAAYDVTVPEGFDRTDLRAYAAERRDAAGFDESGPTLLTGVDVAHARCASDGPVTVLATAGVSNPAALPVEGVVDGNGTGDAPDWRPGTVNLIAVTDRALGDGTTAELLATCVEAKAATLDAVAGYPGTTSDAVVVGCDPEGDPAEFAGSATELGAAARACVRDAVLGSLRSRYPDGAVPRSVAEAEHGVVTDRDPDVFAPS
ncbi:adenosylcobinamide amidohydrolase [Halomicrobium salinisoli]|uniref:adenosylcobinamide amidohydrolase n=1 Tax=Halomicrobium salinisoli TaxID=2878391 RepID=UPI001CF0706B|nr:adenosylcobinamide amidohydrolase [Halomicrobium salinisoli]